jgi:general secretion pathway protein M
MTRTMTLWWQDLSARERLLLGILAALLAVFMLWFGVFRPLTSAIDEARSAHRAAVEQAQRVEALATQIRAARPAVTAASGSAAEVVNASATAAGIEFSTTEPLADGGIIVTIAAIRPLALFPWIAGLADAGISVERLSVQRNSDATLTAQLSCRSRGA